MMYLIRELASIAKAFIQLSWVRTRVYPIHPYLHHRATTKTRGKT
jgi:hypothetical protein